MPTTNAAHSTSTGIANCHLTGDTLDSWHDRFVPQWAGGHEPAGFRLHELKGPLKGHWAVAVSGNWRVAFRFEDGAAVDVDYVDYH